ncbi:MAG: hypothetical protein H0T62_14105 [Parachlamydiaceae bacterium]|nr:hypothetical protein [Parachlamydiaceae bacterium]
MTHKDYIITFLFTLSVSTSFFAYGAEGTVVRAAIDIGSGATKLRVAEIDLKTQKIVNVLESKSFAIPFQEQLSKTNEENFDRQVMDLGIDALKQSVEIAKKYNAEQVIGVSTAAFRKAQNADDYIAEIYSKTGVKVYVIDQHLEGELAFQAVRAQYGYDPEKLVVWDIGGGSLQLTTVNNQGQYEIYRSLDASIPLRNYVITKIKKEDLETKSTPNPLNIEQLLKTQFHAIRLAQKVDQVFKDKIQNPSTEIVGVGNIFGYQVAKIAGGPTVTQEQMVAAVADLAHKSDEHIGGEYANVHVTNAILVLGFMEGLSISNMHVADINPADGAFFYKPFWPQDRFVPFAASDTQQQQQRQIKPPQQQYQQRQAQRQEQQRVWQVEYRGLERRPQQAPFFPHCGC